LKGRNALAILRPLSSPGIAGHSTIGAGGVAGGVA
jgi:hypothetical protein